MMGRSEILVILNGLIGCEPSEVANILYSIIPEGGRKRDEVERNAMNTYLNDLVPPAGDNDGVHDVGAEAHARYPDATLDVSTERVEDLSLLTTRSDHPP